MQSTQMLYPHPSSISDEDFLRSLAPPTLELLEATKARLLKKGWTKGHYGPPEGPNCILGALSEAGRCLNFILFDSAFFMARSLLEKVVSGPYPEPLASWNDSHATKESDVFAALDEAILLAKENL